MAIWSRLLFSALVALAAMSTAQADNTYPARAVTWIVPFTPGGITDHTSRLLSKLLADALGQIFIIENKPGAGGMLGTEAAARAKPDGYTVLYGTQGTMAANPSLYRALRYAPLKDFIPVHGMFATPNVLVVNAKRPYRSVAELVEYAKQYPGKVNMASAGIGTGSHLAGEVFQKAAGIRMTHVPYKGSGPALTDLAAGVVDVMFDYQVSASPHIQSGALRALAVTARERIAALPQVSTMIEVGYPKAGTDSWSGLFVPAGTPPDVVARLSQAMEAALTSKEVRAYANQYGSLPFQGMTQEKFAQFIRDETEMWREVVEFAGVRLD